MRKNLLHQYLKMAMGQAGSNPKMRRKDELFTVDLEREYDLIGKKKCKLPSKIRDAIVQVWEKKNPHIVTVEQKYKELEKKEKG